MFMRKTTLLLGLLFMAVLASCGIKEDPQPDIQPDQSSYGFYGTMEELIPDVLTKAYAEYDEGLNKYFIYWNADDRVSIFEEGTYNREYYFTGRDSAPSGSFERVGTDPSHLTEEPIETGYQYAIYPYHQYNTCDSKGTLTVDIPARQTVSNDEFGVGARLLMVARDAEGKFGFKHVGAYIGVTLKGAGVSVASIAFRGNNDEILAGYPLVDFSSDGEPVMSFNPKDRDNSKEITMEFEEPVTLSSEETVFWLIVPATTLRGGYTLTVTDTQGGTFQKKTTSSITLERKKLYHLRADVEIVPNPDDTHVYARASSVTLGGTYLIVSASDDLVFKGMTNGSFAGVSPVDGVITDSDGTLSAYEFTVEGDGSDYYFKFNDGNYLICDYWGSEGNSSTGLRYVGSQTDITYPFALTASEGTFFFSTTMVNSTDLTPQFLYYKSADNVFKLGASGKDYGVHLYLKGGEPFIPKQPQLLLFEDGTVNWILGDSYEIGGSYAAQVPAGAQTTLSYLSSNADVATISGDQIRIVSTGSTTITVTAEETDLFKPGSTSYTLNIFGPAPDEWVDLGSFSLENDALHDYLDEAELTYNDTNEATVSCVQSYVNQYYSTMSRLDSPAPVTVRWSNPASGSTVISIYEDEALSKVVWTQKASVNTTSSEVYNLVPGRRYYYTVSEDASIWEKGFFNTTGRLRMLKVSDIVARGHANNCRDLGGFVTKDGTKRIKYGYLYRGSNMDVTTPDEKRILTDLMKIRMVVDLRKTPVSTSVGLTDDGNSDAYQAFPAVDYPAIGYYAGSYEDKNDLSNPAKVKSTINAIIDAVVAGKPTYFHCLIGADRTGYFAMILEGVLGISEKDCTIDYELTSFSMGEIRGRDGSGVDYFFSWSLNLFRSQEGNTFQEKMTNYLLGVGITQDRIDAFKNAVLEANN